MSAAVLGWAPCLVATFLGTKRFRALLDLMKEEMQLHGREILQTMDWIWINPNYANLGSVWWTRALGMLWQPSVVPVCSAPAASPEPDCTCLAHTRAGKGCWGHLCQGIPTSPSGGCRFPGYDWVTCISFTALWELQWWLCSCTERERSCGAPPASRRPPSISQQGERSSRKRDVCNDVIPMSNIQIRWYLGIAFASQ